MALAIFNLMFDCTALRLASLVDSQRLSIYKVDLSWSLFLGPDVVA